MSTAVATFTVVEGETFTIGHTPDAARRTVTEVTVTFEGEAERFYRHGEQYLVPCGWCVGGTKREFGHVMNGVCFQCAGRGFSGVKGTVAEVEKIVRRRVRARQRAERKRVEAEAAKAAAAAAWREANPEAAAIVDEIMATPEDERADRWGFAYEIARQSTWRSLSEKQVAAMVKAHGEANAAQAAEAERAAQQRYHGAVGERVTVTGTVTVAASIEGEDPFGRPRYSMLIVVEGTGEHAGVTVKTFGSGKTLWDAERGQQVNITGTVKAHEVYEGVAQTVVTRSKIEEQA